MDKPDFRAWAIDIISGNRATKDNVLVEFLTDQLTTCFNLGADYADSNWWDEFDQSVMAENGGNLIKIPEEKEQYPYYSTDDIEPWKDNNG